MFKLTSLMILIVVAAFAVQPVMACCLTGHGEAAIADADTATPSCHDATESMSDVSLGVSHEMPGPVDCPGCLDCDSAIMQAQSIDDSALLTQLLSDVPIAVLSAKFTGFGYKTTVYKTGPPVDPPLKASTPISLKQRLLI